MKPAVFSRGVALFSASLLVFLVALGLRPCCAAAAAARPEAQSPKSKGAGQFSESELAADRDGAVLLTIPAPGRYAFRAHSASGVAIQLVDMMAGPGDVAGARGLKDGRLDALLDQGVYKIRVLGAKGAAGKAKLTAEPFQELEPKRITLSPGQKYGGELSDLEQRSYSVEIGPSGRLSIEAVGRALQDLRLWRPGGELVEIAPTRRTIEPQPGRPATRLRLEGSVEPGRYIVTAYGGESLVWREGGVARPFLLRLDTPLSLAAGVAEGAIGPFGSARFEAPADYDAFRLELPEPTEARLEAKRSGSTASATIGKASREPVAVVTSPANGKDPAIIEVSGVEGQAFRLRALRQASRLAIAGSGPHLVAVDVAGEGGDEIPATALLARSETGGMRVLASDLPRIAPGGAWRRKFNLRGPSSLLFEATANGPVAIRTQGPHVRATIEPVFGSLAQRADGRQPAQYDLQAGFYLLSLEPIEGATGVIDVTLGSPGLAPEVSPPAPPRSIISFGERQIEADASYSIIVNSAPGLLTGPRAVAFPADLAKGPVPLWQEASTEISIPVRAPRGGKISAVDSKGANIPLRLTDEKTENDTRFATVRIVPTEQARALGVLFVAESPKPPPEERASHEARPESLTASPHFFDLARGERREFRFAAPRGGLYRVETLGRLQTSVAIGTNFQPRIGEGSNNGPGHNGLVTAYLRAGSYRAAVSAEESAGHLGLSIRPAALDSTAALSGEGSVRASLSGGRGAIVPIEIPSDGLYRIDLQGLGREWQARLEDADGWPLMKPGKLTRLMRRFEKGAYRLVVLPEDVEARMLARLRPVIRPSGLEGHGPHPLPFETTQKLQWREPASKSEPRVPDLWRFSLQGDAHVEIEIGEGMVAEIVRDGQERVAKFAAGRKFDGQLGPGDYAVEARSLAHDDRLDYEISLKSKELQPGAARFVDVPATVQFATGADRIIDLVSFGNRELVGVLKDSNGAVVERLEGRADDWNIALSRRLPAGAYTLEISELGARPSSGGEARDESAQSSEENESSPSGETSPEAADAEQATEEAELPPENGIEIRLSLPNSAPEGTLAFNQARTVSGAGDHEFALPVFPEGSLAVVAAQSARELALSIERRGEDGQWRVIGHERGLSPVAAWPAPTGDKGDWRAVVWTVGGGDAQIAIGAKSVTKISRALGEVALDPAPVEGVGAKFCAALVAIPSATLVQLDASQSALAAGSTPGRLLPPARSGPLAPQSERLWFVSRDGCEQKLRVATVEWGRAELGLALGEGERATLPVAPTSSGLPFLSGPARKARLWRARSAFGQPAVDAGRSFGAAPGAALALAGKDAPHVWNASGPEPLRLTVQAIDVDVAAPAKGDALYSALIPPLTAQPVEMKVGRGPLTLDLSSGIAAFSAPDQPEKIAAFGDGQPVSRTLNRAPEKIGLVNTSDRPAPARMALEPGKGETLAEGKIVKRFHGAAGQISYPVDGEKGDRLVVAGGEATFVGESGLVARGASLQIDGRGEVVVDHKAGLVALWIERNGKTPWPAPQPRAIVAPQQVALEGAAQAFSLELTTQVLINVRSSAPAIVAFTQNGQRVLETFPAGVEFHRYATPGSARLEIYSPHDGPLAGALDIVTNPVIPVKEGVNDPVTLAAGASVLFGFEATRTGEVGIGLRSEPDHADLRLFDTSGKALGEGLAQTVRLAPGRYIVEARAPVDAPLSVVRLAVIGLSPPPAGPPPEVLAEFLEKAGLKTGKKR